MEYLFWTSVVAAAALVNGYVDFEISFTRSESGSYCFRTEISLKKMNMWAKA